MPATPKTTFRLRLIAAALALAVGFTMAPPAAASAKTPPPPARLASAQIDAHLGYMPQTTCSPSAKAGTKALLSLLIKTWGGSSSGISRGCGVGGRSEHKEGRALDWHMSVKKASQRNRVAAAMKFITANNGEVALRLGIMYMIWNQHIWSTYYPELGWRKMEDRGGATANHKDHVHISLSWDGAYKQTSWWTGTPIVEPLNSRCGASGVRACLPTIPRTSKSWPYLSTKVPASFTPAAWTLPGVGGSPQVGRLQRAVPGKWVPAGATLTYQWTSNGRSIPGATAASYLLPPEQVGREVEVRVTATLGSSVETRASNNIAAVYPARMAAAGPRIAGVLAPGKILRINLGTWKPAPTRLTFAWLRDGKKIKGATGSTFTVRAKDKGHKISVRVSGYRLGYYSATATSAKARISSAFGTVGTPTISGSATIGSELVGSTGSWNPAPTAFSYQWYADGVAIAGATKTRFTVTSAQAGRTLVFTAVGRRSGYASTDVRSAGFGPIS